MRRALSASLLMVLCALLPGDSDGQEAARCPSSGRAIVVHTAAHSLALCDDGRAVAAYPVSLGRAGVGKREAGDNKTPLGRYPLAAPRPSTRFGTFLPVGYPTADEIHRGFSGGDIGVHGPRRDYRWLGRLSRLSDWTRGCIAVATDEEIGAIAEWVRRRGVREIVLE